MWINSVANKNIQLDKDKMNFYFYPDVSYKVNRKVLAKDVNSLFVRFKKLLISNEIMQIVIPLDQIIIADSQAAVTYQLHIKNKQNGEYIDHITTLITFSNEKIKTWDAVAAHATN